MTMDQPREQPKLKLEKFSVISLHFDGTALMASTEFQVTHNIRPAIGFADGAPHNYGVRFVVEFSKDEHSTPFMQLVAEGEFSTDVEIDEKFKKSLLVTLNSPAIVFPYIRSFITMFTSSAGYTPIILPTLNFVPSGLEPVESSNADNSEK